MRILLLVPIGVLVQRGYWFPQQMIRLTEGNLDPRYALCRN